MKAGELVFLDDDRWTPFSAWYDNLPCKNRTYQVREVRPPSGDDSDPNPETKEESILLEGLENGHDPHFTEFVELSFRSSRFLRPGEKKRETPQIAKPLTQATLF